VAGLWEIWETRTEAAAGGWDIWGSRTEEVAGGWGIWGTRIEEAAGGVRTYQADGRQVRTGDGDGDSKRAGWCGANGPTASGT